MVGCAGATVSTVIDLASESVSWAALSVAVVCAPLMLCSVLLLCCAVLWSVLPAKRARAGIDSVRDVVRAAAKRARALPPARNAAQAQDRGVTEDVRHPPAAAEDREAAPGGATAHAGPCRRSRPCPSTRAKAT